jgi:hypothetical protein
MWKMRELAVSETASSRSRTDYNDAGGEEVYQGICDDIAFAGSDAEDRRGDGSAVS